MRDFRKHKRSSRSARGFSLVEVMVTIALLIIILSGLFRLFVFCSTLAGISGNMTLAMSEVQDKLEEIRNTDYGSIASTYNVSPDNTFLLTKLSEDLNANGALDTGEDKNGNGTLDYDGRGFIYIDDSNPALLQVKVVVSWQTPSGRILGEDINFNGVLDMGEDVNGNGRFDSPTRVVTLIARK